VKLSPRSNERPALRGVALATAAAILATCLPGSVAMAAASGQAAPAAPHDRSVAVAPVTSHYRPPASMPAWRPAAVAWPSGAADVTPAAAPARAGSLPVWVGAPSGAPARVHVNVASRQAAAAAGVTGVLASVGRTDGAGARAPVRVTLGYSVFRDAFGGDWASRLRLVQLPACALTRPADPACRTQTPVASTRDARAGTLTANVAVAAAPMVLAATSSDAGGGGGDYTATAPQSSSSWQAGGSSDSFTWSYPIPVPPVPGGFQPQVALSYDSQSVDGLTSSTNNQASWIGDGWQYNPGFVERGFSSCTQNPAGPTKTSDTCWSASNTLTLSLEGRTSTLVRDDATGTYHPQGDGNERVQDLTGAVNGAQNGEYFVVTDAGGTQFFFGLNRLPGWASGNQETDSVWTEPVYAPGPGQPCYNATFSSSWCQQAYRWNLDYAVDTHSDVVSYFYATESNAYAADLASTATTSYTRSGRLLRIQYGQRAGQVYGTQPAAQVLFNSSGRCTQSTCDPSTLSQSTASSWPDVPADLSCATGAACQIQSPSFWGTYALQSIQTQSLVNSTETNVDSWSLSHTFPATGDSTTPSLWLSAITHTGQDTSAGGSSAPITLPALSFTGTPLANRVNLGSGFSPITRLRLTEITTESGGIIDVNYSGPGCASSVPSDPSQNTSLCYPGYWTPTGQTAPMLDWFNKFIVTGVTARDLTGGSANDTVATTYTPVGSPAWHHDDNPLTPANQRTWDQWRGFQGMTVSTGTAPNPIATTTTTYLRGMNGDTLPNGGSRSVSVTDSRGDPAVADADQYAGFTYETIVLNGGAVVSDTIADPWSSAPTATHALSGGLPAQHAFHLGTADSRVYTPLAKGGTRETETIDTHDGAGRVVQLDDLGDLSTPADDLCTATTYADNTTANILDRASETTTVSVSCSTTPSLPGDAVSDTQVFYDGSTTLGTPPAAGDATMTRQAASYTGSTPSFVTPATITVDEYGRPTAVTDADNRTTTTAYTPAAGAEPTSLTVTDPMQQVRTTTQDPLRDLPETKTDPAGYASTEQYDALGRLTAVYDAGEPVNTGTPNLEYTYALSNTGPSVVDAYALNDDGSYRLTETLYDSQLRARETQTQTPDGGRTIADTMYDTNGQVSETTDPYFNASTVAPTYVQAPADQVPSATGYAYDAAGRRVSATAYALGSPTWSTTYTYSGDAVTTVPPSGATATTAFTDARGHTTDLYQYHAGVPADPANDPPADYSDTHYTYTPGGRPATVADDAGNTWSYQYDLLGRQSSAQDPDSGTTASTYDDAGQVITSTDARGKQTTTTYDLDGRKTGQYDTTATQTLSTANAIATWAYDSVKKSYPASSTSYSAGDVYTRGILGYNAQALPSAVRTTLTGEGTALFPSGGIVTGYGYNGLTGRLTNENDAAVGGLPAENVQYGYDQFGEPTSVGSAAWTYVQAVGYTEFGEPTQYTMPSTAGSVWLTLSYDQQTRALTEARTVASNATAVVDDTTYRYASGSASPGAGLVTSTTDVQNGVTTDTQCFAYDFAERLSSAWTATDGCSAVPSPGSTDTVGGPNPYWQSWTYDAAGDRRTQTDHSLVGNTANDTTTTYNYPAAGSSTDQPHTLQSTTATGPAAGQDTATFSYDASGDTTSTSGGASGSQTLTWDDQGELATDTTAAGTTAYAYDTTGNLLVRRDPGQTTVFVGDEQLVLDTSAGTVTGTRYYGIGGTIIASRSSSGAVTDLIPDRQGTDQLAVNASTQAVARRQYLPFGQARGIAPPTWPGGDKGFVGGAPDPATQLENLGAREYDPATGRFLSPDPIFQATQPNLMGGYDYAGNDPTTMSDPTGMDPIPNCPVGDVACFNCSYSGNCGAPGSDGGGAEVPPGVPTINPCWDACATVQHQREVDRRLAAVGITGDKISQAEAIKHKTIVDIVMEAGGEFLKGLLGIDDMEHCFGNGDVGACVSLILSVLPIDKLFEVGARVFKFVVRAIEAVRDFRREVQEADKLLNEVHDVQREVDALSVCKNSFVGSTPVLMADGSAKPIEQVRIGDRVRTAAPDSATVLLHVVTAIHVTDTDRAFDDVVIATSAGPRTIVATAHHPFWDVTIGTWTDAADLRAGDQLDTPGDGHATVLRIVPFTAAIRTYNLTVDATHTYYVEAGPTSVLVHNTGPCDGDEVGLDHSAAKHMPDGAERGPNDGVWNPDEDLASLARGSAGKVGVRQLNGNIRYTVQADHYVGTTGISKQRTTMYTIIRDPYGGDLVTMWPGTVGPDN
jgi:RHS repeat-associated protein